LDFSLLPYCILNWVKEIGRESLWGPPPGPRFSQHQTAQEVLGSPFFWLLFPPASFWTCLTRRHFSFFGFFELIIRDGFQVAAIRLAHFSLVSRFFLFPIRLILSSSPWNTPFCFSFCFACHYFVRPNFFVFNWLFVGAEDFSRFFYSLPFSPFFCSSFPFFLFASKKFCRLSCRFPNPANALWFPPD